MKRSKAWQEIDVDGGGLQSVNAVMTRLMRHTKTAYALWLLFPVGAHRAYLRSYSGSVIYTAITAITIILWITIGSTALWIFAAEALIAVADLFWIDRRVTQLNKELRMQVYLQRDHVPPDNFRGKYVDGADDHLTEYLADKNRERPAERKVNTEDTRKTSRVMSFAEQEKLLKETLKKRP